MKRFNDKIVYDEGCIVKIKDRDEIPLFKQSGKEWKEAINKMIADHQQNHGTLTPFPFPIKHDED